MYAGNILVVDLNTGQSSTRPTKPYADKFIGGRGINARLLYELAPPHCDPIGPDNVLIFGTGALCGMPAIPGMPTLDGETTPINRVGMPMKDGEVTPFNRVEITAKSPETGILGSANMGGAFGIHLKRSGFDHVAFTGASDTPVYLYLHDGQAEIRDATALWGKDTYETQTLLQLEHGPDASIACIGPAGENLVRFASVRSGRGHAASRTGLGCVMGSKRLKAIVAQGTQKLEFADYDKCQAALEDWYQEMRSRWWFQETSRFGLTRTVDEYKRWWSAAPDADVPSELIRNMKAKYSARQYGCLGCPTPCMEYYPGTDDATRVVPKAEDAKGTVLNCAYYIYPTYVTRSRDRDVFMAAVDTMQRAGIDVSSTFTIIGWLMQCQENGVTTPADTDGIDLQWGSSTGIPAILAKIISRDGIGDVLANGMKSAAKQIGRNSEFYADAVKGLPLYGVPNPGITIGDKGMALGHVMSPRADTMKTLLPAESFEVLRTAGEEQGIEAYAKVVHFKPEEVTLNENTFNKDKYDGKAEQAILGEDLITINDLLGFCKLQSWHLGATANERIQSALLSAASGREFTGDDLFHYARAVNALQRAYNVREGTDRSQDVLPPHMVGRSARAFGIARDRSIDPVQFEELKNKYYQLRRWTVTGGVPTQEALEGYGMADIAADLKRLGLLGDDVPAANPPTAQAAGIPASARSEATR